VIEAQRVGADIPVTDAVETIEVRLFGVMAEFRSAEGLLEATRRAYAAGYRAMDAYSPFPVEELAEALGSKHTLVPWITLTGGVLGAITGYGLQFWVHVMALPINVGGRGLNSWPAFIPVTFELTVLGAAAFAVLGMLALNKLPQPHHPVFNAPRFALASNNRFFLCIEARDPKFDRVQASQFLERLKAHDLTEVFDE